MHHALHERMRVIIVVFQLIKRLKEISAVQPPLSLVCASSYLHVVCHTPPTAMVVEGLCLCFLVLLSHFF